MPTGSEVLMQGRPDMIPKMAGWVLMRQEEDATVLFNEETGEPFLLNETGGRILELADGTRTAGAITSELAAIYEADTSEIEADVMEILDVMAEKGLIVYL